MRLCVETDLDYLIVGTLNAAAFVRLCVETIGRLHTNGLTAGSRLRAAVC